MGSSILHSQAVLLAGAFGALFLLFDTARFFFFQLGPVRLRRLAGDENGGARGLFRYHPQHFLLITGVLLQIAIAGGVAFTILAFWSHGPGRALSLTALIWGSTIVIWKILLALVPEGLAEVMLKGIVPVSHIFYYLFWPLLFPLRWLVVHIDKREDESDDEEKASDEQVQAYIDVGEDEGILEEGDGKLIQSIVDFGDRVARELMTPRTDMLAYDAKRPIAELARIFMESKYSRIPIYEETIDKIVGVVHVKEVFEAVVLKQEKTVREIARPAYFVSETKLVSELLREFQIEHLQIAFVVDEYGGTAGLITIEDVLEEIVGEISDEHEEDEESLVELGDDKYMVNGLLRVDTLEDKVGVDLQGDDYETVAGLIFTIVGRVPKVGETIRKNGLLFEVDRADRKRIYRVRVSRDPDWTADDQQEQRSR